MRIIAGLMGLSLLVAACGGNDPQITDQGEEVGTVIIRVRAQNNTAAAGVPTFLSKPNGQRQTKDTNTSGIAQYDSVAIGLWQAGWTETSTYVVTDANVPTVNTISVAQNRTTETQFTVKRQVVNPGDRERRR